MVVVGRFLALLELYRDGTVRFEQEKALAQLTIDRRATGQGSIVVEAQGDAPARQPHVLRIRPHERPIAARHQRLRGS